MIAKKLNFLHYFLNLILRTFWTYREVARMYSELTPRTHHLDLGILYIHALYSQCQKWCALIGFLLFCFLSFSFFFQTQCANYLLGPSTLKIHVISIFCPKNLFNFFDSLVSSVFCFLFQNLLLGGCWTSWIFSSSLSCFLSLPFCSWDWNRLPFSFNPAFFFLN